MCVRFTSILPVNEPKSVVLSRLRRDLPKPVATLAIDFKPGPEPPAAIFAAAAIEKQVDNHRNAIRLRFSMGFNASV